MGAIYGIGVGYMRYVPLVVAGVIVVGVIVGVISIAFLIAIELFKVF